MLGPTHCRFVSSVLGVPYLFVEFLFDFFGYYCMHPGTPLSGISDSSTVIGLVGLARVLMALEQPPCLGCSFGNDENDPGDSYAELLCCVLVTMEHCSERCAYVEFDCFDPLSVVVFRALVRLWAR